MKAVIQRVKHASVTVAGQTIGKIGPGLLILLGVQKGDSQCPEHLPWLVNKIAGLRVFKDEQGKMNLGLRDGQLEALVISQFTLFGNSKKGFRPSFQKAAPPQEAIPIYESFVKALQKELSKPVQTGEFGADMDVELLNDGPVTICIDTHHRDA